MPSDTDIIIALAKKLQTQTTTDLSADNAALRRERDDARAQGISDLNTIHRHQATIRRLEAKCAALEVDKAAMSASNAALRAGQGTWPDEKTNAKYREAGLTPLRRVHPEYTSEDMDRVVADYLAGDTEPASRLIIRRDLTVHALNIAPVGSVARSDDALYSKHTDGEWREPNGFKWNSETIIRRHPEAHLYTPGGA